MSTNVKVVLGLVLFIAVAYAGCWLGLRNTTTTDTVAVVRHGQTCIDARTLAFWNNKVLAHNVVCGRP